MKSNTIGDIRAPQLVGMFGPGSIVNLEKLSVMPLGTSQWNDFGATIESTTFRQQIGASRLIDTAKLADSGIGVTLFPKTFICRTCGTIQKKHALKDFELRQGLHCYRGDGGQLYPSRWIVYCESGHIDDFSYSYFLHGNSSCPERLILETGATLATTWVRCECGARKSMIDAYGQRVPATRCSGRSPWLDQTVDCSAKAKISMKSASDVYFGAVRSAISIEPESNPLVRAVFEKLNSADPSYLNEQTKAKNILKPYLPFSQANDIDLDAAINEFFLARHDQTTYRDRRRIEFEALAKSCGSPREDLYVEAMEPAGLADRGFNGLFAVRKLREVRALVGFRRGGMPPDPAFDDAGRDEELAKVGPSGVFPAYENRGEGIFMTFDPARLSSWLDRPAVRKRIAMFESAERRLKASSGSESLPRSRGLYVLAHTFSHLMIRQLALLCGYSQSSLRERIYAGADDATPWAGFLIYTSSSDADGSLGGLVGIATDGRVETVLQEALESMRICSSDPVCALQTPRGFRKMNGSACHGCVVLPETCCERNNYFLDRTFVVPGTVSDDTLELCYSNPL